MKLFTKTVSLLFLGLTSLPVFSQQQDSVYHFTSGLLANAPARYGREAIYTDELAYKLYTNTLRTPVKDENFAKDDKGAAIVWKAVTADSANRLFLRGQGRGFFGRSGYIYLTYTAQKEQMALLNVKGNSSVYFDNAWHAGDPYASGWLYVPVHLKKGLNEFYVRGTFITASLHFPSKSISLNTEDATLPFIVAGTDNSNLTGAVVIINATSQELKGLSIKSKMNDKEMTVELPHIPAMSSRKIPFRFNGSSITGKGKFDCHLSLLSKNKVIDEKTVPVESVTAAESYSQTFISNIDGSVQYYAVTPQSAPAKESALFLSVHGAGVEAIGQARAYKPKDWGNLVAATNRRPRGFNWEDWGRLDALEVLTLAKEKFKPHPQKIYLTGHSMGGHGTWFLGATYPDKWAAIAPCAGYPTLKGYGSADGLIPDSSSSPLEQTLLRSGNQSDVIKLATNYKPLGVYVFHGDSDKVVSVNYARQMRKELSGFHNDFSYYEYPGGEHWFGDHSVDWAPLFDFFKWHNRAADSAVDHIDFTTANPGISASFRWASIEQQTYPLSYSRIQLHRNKKTNTISGRTENVRLLKLVFENGTPNTAYKIVLDDRAALTFEAKSASDSVFLMKEEKGWIVSSKPSLQQKGPHRYGTFKEAFNNRMIFVYSTRGTKEENEWSKAKALYDAETWYYRGNGAVDIIADKDFSLAKYKDRGVILFGNKTTNSAWQALLSDCPIQVERNKIMAGKKAWQGGNLGAYFTWPIKGSAMASVSVIAGSGMEGMKAANANQYFAGASGFPDFMIFDLDMLQTGVHGVRFAGFFNNNWELDEANSVERN